MTPQEAFKYKLRWMPGHGVKLHSDLLDKGIGWCKANVSKECWTYKRHTNVYEHTFRFEDIKAAQNFEMEFGSYAEKE